ncbi:hypothetical protein AB0A95_24555 [Micromonospora sp. NPDC049230]|uniref:hypothetical protein n=1 Tax=Micromonospora sp. NPDC049230 TaxID=3155502 RepID=UPI0033D6359E
MTVTAVEITSRPSRAASTGKQPTSKQEPAGVVITQVDALITGNERGCGDDNPYN